MGFEFFEALQGNMKCELLTRRVQGAVGKNNLLVRVSEMFE